MDKKEIEFEIEKETKNTIRYKETAEDGIPPILNTIYVQKWVVGSKPPKKIKMTIEEV